MNQNEVPRGLKNNNPLNIRISKDVFQGEKIPSSDRVFKQFTSVAYGYRAGFKIICNYCSKYKLRTIRGIISRWAPENENDTLAYVRLVSSYSGIGPDDIIDSKNQEQMISIAAGMSKVENGREAVMSDVVEGWSLL